MKTKRTGPKTPYKQEASARINIRIPKKLKTQFNAKAKASGKTLSVWMVEALLEFSAEQSAKKTSPNVLTYGAEW